MELIRIGQNRFGELKSLQIAYKQEIGEDEPTEENFKNLAQAIQDEQIFFYACIVEERLIGCCSVSPTFHFQLSEKRRI